MNNHNNNKLKFNPRKGKLKYFPIKDFVFDVSQHPILFKTDKCSFKIKSILSPQEEQMMIALKDSLNVPIREAMRIALSKVCKLPSEEVEKTIPFILALSKKRGHTARSRKLELRLPKDEKEAFKSLAKTHKLNEHETVRLFIIHEQKAIRAGIRTKYENGRILEQGEIWDAWSKDRPESSGKLDALYKASDDAVEELKIKDAERYLKRGEMIRKCYEEGQNSHTDMEYDDGEINLNYIDRLIAVENAAVDEFAWDKYLHEQLQNETDEFELKVRRELFILERYGIEATRDEIIAVLKQEPLTEEEENEVEEFRRNLREFMDAHNKELREQGEKALEKEIFNRSGWDISTFDWDVRQRIREEYKWQIENRAGKEWVNEEEGMVFKMIVPHFYHSVHERPFDPIKSVRNRFKNKPRRRKKRN